MLGKAAGRPPDREAACVGWKVLAGALRTSQTSGSPPSYGTNQDESILPLLWAIAGGNYHIVHHAVHRHLDMAVIRVRPQILWVYRDFSDPPKRCDLRGLLACTWPIVYRAWPRRDGPSSSSKRPRLLSRWQVIGPVSGMLLDARTWLLSAL